MQRVRIPDSGVVPVPCSCCGRFRFVVNATEFKASYVYQLTLCCKECVELYTPIGAHEWAMKRRESGWNPKKIAEQEYMRAWNENNPPRKKRKYEKKEKKVKDKFSKQKLTPEEVIKKAEVVADMSEMIDGDIADAAAEIADQIIRTGIYSPGDLADLIHYERLLTARLLLMGALEKAR